MPCYESGSRDGDLECSLDEARRKNTKTTRLLCATLEAVEGTEGFGALPEDVKKWWANHKRVDARRKKAEQAIRDRKRVARKAKAKLSRAERNALGLE